MKITLKQSKDAENQQKVFEELTQKTDVALKDKQAELDHIQQVSQNRIDFLLEKMVTME